MTNTIESKIQELVIQYGYDAKVLGEFAEFVQSQLIPQKSKGTKSTSKSKTSAKSKAPKMKELQEAVVVAFGCKDLKELKKHEAFKLATVGRDLNLRTTDAWLVLYREWVGVPENERREEGETCINGIDVLKNFRPWHVFELDPKTATKGDIDASFRRLAKQHHPDQGGNREVFERIQKMRDSLLAFR